MKIRSVITRIRQFFGGIDYEEVYEYVNEYVAENVNVVAASCREFRNCNVLITNCDGKKYTSVIITTNKMFNVSKVSKVPKLTLRNLYLKNIVVIFYTTENNFLYEMDLVHYENCYIEIDKEDHFYIDENRHRLIGSMCKNSILKIKD